MSNKNKSREKSEPDAATVAEETFDELANLDWGKIPGGPYVMKYKFEEDGYTLMVSNLAAVYGEKIDGKAIQERFQIINPYAEMLPNIIIKHLKQSVENILAGEEAQKETVLKITLDSNLINIQHQFYVGGVHFIYNFKPEMLSDNKFRAHVLRPILLRSLVFGEEITELENRVIELEGRCSYSSSSGFGQKPLKTIYSAIKKVDPSESGVIDAFLYVQNDKTTLPESLGGYLSPKKKVLSSAASSAMCRWERENAALNGPSDEDAFMLYCDHDHPHDSTLRAPHTIQSEDHDLSINFGKTEEDYMLQFPEKYDSDLNLGSPYTTHRTEEPQNSRKREHIEDDNADMIEFTAIIENLVAKQSLKKEESPEKEMAEEDSKEENAPKPTPSVKPSPAKKKKLMKF